MTQLILVNAENTVGTRQAAEELGIDIDTRMLELGLDPSLLDRREGYIPWLQFNDLLESVAKSDACHVFGLYIGKHQPATRLGVLGHLLRVCPDIRTMIEKGQQYIAVLTQACFWDSHVDEHSVMISRIPRFSQTETYGQSNTLGVTQTFKLLQALCGADWKPNSISFVHPAPDEYTRREYRKFFDVPVDFSQESDSIIFSAKYLDREIATADSQLLAVLEDHARSLMKTYSIDSDLVTKVRLLIRKTLSTSYCDINHIAQVLELHPKTLHRELKKFDVTFKRLSNEERHSLAAYYLSKSDIKLTVLADLLGYSDSTALSRAFKNHCGLSPQLWKQQHGALL